MHCHGNVHGAYEYDSMALGNLFVQADVVSFGSESDTNISPCILVQMLQHGL